jgi:hypothetical protein
MRSERFEVNVPLAGLSAGVYEYQVNLIDDALSAFSFPRMAIKIVDPLPAAADSTAISPLELNKLAGADLAQCTEVRQDHTL